MARERSAEGGRGAERDGYAEALRRIEGAKRERATSLDLSGLGLTALPPEIGQLTELTTLDAQTNQLTTLLPEIGQLTGLTTLDASNNQLNTLPPEIGQLTALTTLWVQYDQLITLPPEISQLTALTRLDASHNQLTLLPPEIGQLTALTTLWVQYNQLITLPPEIGQLKGLMKLWVQNNQLTSLPPEIGHLAALTTLVASSNQLITLPAEIGQLTALTKLHASRNQLTTLPPEIGQLTALTALYAGDNQLTTLPPEIGQLTALTELNVAENQLTTLPPEIGQLTALMTLHLSSNQLGKLPPEIGQFTALTELNVAANQLTTLPVQIRQLTSLQALDLHDNPALGMPPEALGNSWVETHTGQGKPAPPSKILEYFFRTHGEVGSLAEPPRTRRRRRPGKDPARPKTSHVHEARLIVIGDGESGKTSLVRALLHNKPARKLEETTRDVLIEDWRPVLSEPQTKRRHKVAVHVWDFGGQEPLHAAHPYFFTSRTLYLVVASSRQDGVEERISYWLKMVAAHGRGARALVAVNKVDQHPMDLKQRELCAEHAICLPPNPVEAFFATSCRGKMRGIAELRRAILRELAGMEQIWMLVPAEWMAVKGSLAQRRAHDEDTLTFDEWADVCAECRVAEAERTAALDLLRDFGTVVSFPEDESLSSLGVLNPSWVTRAVYPLLTSGELASAGGLLRRRDLARLLDDAKRYPRHKHPWLIDLMRKFELLFENDSRLLLPARLPKDAPVWADDGKWGTPETLRLELRYRVLPESVISKFIVRWHERALEAGRWWRHGIAVQDSGGRCAALVRAYLGAPGYIALRVHGPKEARQQFVGALRETLYDLGRNLGGELWVVLDGVHPERYDDLLLLAHAGERRIKRVPDASREAREFDLVAALDLVEPPAQQREALQRLTGFALDMSRHVHVDGDMRESDVNLGRMGT